MMQCGMDRPTLPTTATEGLVIGPDGTIYFSAAGSVRVMRPGMPAAQLVALQGASTVWGLALDAANNKLYVGVPSSRRIDVVDLAATPPTATTFVSGAGAPNGLTMGPDGALWYTDFTAAGHVYRVSSDGMRTRVTNAMMPIRNPNGLAFDREGNLYVDSYMDGIVIRLTLANNMESGRTTIQPMGASIGSPDGLALDAMGRLYVTNNSGGTLVRMDADGSNAVVLRTGMPAAANIDFGVGALPCTDIYVATGRGLARYEMGDTPGAAVPWHR